MANTRRSSAAHRDTRSRGDPPPPGGSPQPRSAPESPPTATPRAARAPRESGIRLILESPGTASDLNLTLAQRASVALVGLGIAALVLALHWPSLMPLGLTSLAAVVLLNL